MAGVLIIDDYADTGRVLAKRFGHAGISATAATDAAGAVAALLTDRPKVVLLDVCMPGVDGMEILRQIRADPQWNRVVVLMFSAVVGLDVRIQAMKLGAQGYVDKGTPFEEIRAEVERHLATA